MPGSEALHLRQGPQALDFNSDAVCFFNGVELFDADTSGQYPLICEAVFGDAFRQCFHEPHVTLGNQVLDVVHHALVADDIGQAVIQGFITFGDREVHIDDDWLSTAFFVAMDADMGIKTQIPDKHMTGQPGGIRYAKRCYVS